MSLPLPMPYGMEERLEMRRKDLATYKKQEAGLTELFRQCASEEISNEQFYEMLPSFWSFEVGDRMQGSGWERQGKNSDFRVLSQSFLRIIAASDEDRDDIVVKELNLLSKLGLRTRGAFLSEMLCLKFPEKYPVLNKPVWEYLSRVKYRSSPMNLEGVRFLHLATTLRASLRQNPKHPAKNLAELDTVIWLASSQETKHW